jgi:hypothetical protein
MKDQKNRHIPVPLRTKDTSSALTQLASATEILVHLSQQASQGTHVPHTAATSSVRADVTATHAANPLDEADCLKVEVVTCDLKKVSHSEEFRLERKDRPSH